MRRENARTSRNMKLILSCLLLKFNVHANTSNQTFNIHPLSISFNPPADAHVSLALISAQSAEKEPSNSRNSFIIALLTFQAIILLMVLQLKGSNKRMKKRLDDIQNKQSHSEMKHLNNNDSKLNEIIHELARIHSNFDAIQMKISQLREQLTQSPAPDLGEHVLSDLAVKNLARLISLKIINEESWREFKQLFSQSFPAYYDFLTKTFKEELTEGDLRLIMLLKLQYDYNEMGECLGISCESARIAVYRLKKKFAFNGNASELNQMFLNRFKTQQ